eukprot:519996_1
MGSMNVKTRNNGPAHKATEYTTCWYIRKHFESLKSIEQLFPDSIKLLCALFVGILLNDEWEQKSNHSKGICTFGSNNRCIKRINDIHKWNTSICGEMAIDFTYIWRLKIGRCNEKKFGSLIGIVPNGNITVQRVNGTVKRFKAIDKRFDMLPYNGYSYWGYAREIRHDKFQKRYGVHLYPNDVIEIHLNMKDLHIKFVVNDVEQGIAFRNILNTKYRLMIVLYNNDHVELLDSR